MRSRTPVTRTLQSSVVIRSERTSVSFAKMTVNAFMDVDFDISQEDFRDIELLEASIFQEIEQRCTSDLEESRSEDEINCPSKKRKRRIIHSESESDVDSVADLVAEQISKLPGKTHHKWSHVKGHQPSVIAFTEQTGKLITTYLFYFIWMNLLCIT